MKVIYSKRLKRWKLKVNRRVFKKVVYRIADLAKLAYPEDSILAINIVDGEIIELINRQFLKHDGITDVIAFNYFSNDNDRIEDYTADDFVAGEIFICPEAAKMESDKRGSSFNYELLLYVVHGILHLAGEDDLDPVSRRRMRRLERTIMNRLSKEFDIENIFL